MANRKKNGSAKGAIVEPYQEKSKPLSALFLAMLGLLIFVALFNYEWGQSRQTTTNPVSENIVGAFGAESSYLLYHWLGLGSWLVPLFLYWLAFLFASARTRRLRRLKSIGYPISFLCATGLLSVLDSSLRDLDEKAVLSVCHFGLGGQLGTIVYTDSLQNLVNWFGSIVIFLAVLSAALFAIITNDMGAAFDRFREWMASFFLSFLNSVKETKGAYLKKRAEAKDFKAMLKRETKTKKEELKKANTLSKENKFENAIHSEGDDSADRLLNAAEIPKTQHEKVKKNGSDEDLEKKTEPSTTKPTIQEMDASRVQDSTQNSRFKIVQAETVDRVDPAIPVNRGNYEFPSINLLAEVPEYQSVPQSEIEDTANRLKQTLSEFKIKVDLGEVHTGPVITRYDIHPAPGVKVEKIAGLDKNLAMSMRAEAVRVLAPVPGKGCVGVEVPNRKPLAVCMREIIESQAWADAEEGLPLILGKDVSGKPLVADLTKMPHLLIAGSTGSGKSVCLNSIIASMCYFGSPEEVRFIMVDPKIVEMQAYNSLPHMLIPVVTNPKKVPGALKWLISEMERRYQLFKNAGVRNIAGFNDKILKNKKAQEHSDALDAVLSPEERAAVNATLDSEVELEEDFQLPESKLPYVVCIIDELADLMMVAPADIETSIARIAQLARAAGIHLILATQRPSVNVITGVIKANLPSRIAFKVASYRDSMTILDCKGAETLIGKGDMLFIPPGASSLVRAQGAFMSDEEIHQIVEFLKCNGPPNFVEEVQRQVEASGEESEDNGIDGEDTTDLDDDEILLRKVLQVMKASRRASTSMFQRRLKIGYNRAGRIMDMLEDRGYVGPDNGSQPREILIDLDSL